MATPSLRAAINGKCRDCGSSPEAGRLWRDPVAACQVISCPLWPARPLPRTAPDFITARDPDALPSGWCRLGHEEAVASVRDKIAVTTLPEFAKSSGAESPAADYQYAEAGPLPLLEAIRASEREDSNG